MVGRNHYRYTLNELIYTMPGAESPTGEISRIVVPVVDFKLDDPATLRSIGASNVTIYSYTDGNLSAVISLPNFTTVVGRRVTATFVPPSRFPLDIDTPSPHHCNDLSQAVRSPPGSPAPKGPPWTGVVVR